MIQVMVFWVISPCSLQTILSFPHTATVTDMETNRNLKILLGMKKLVQHTFVYTGKFIQSHYSLKF